MNFRRPGKKTGVENDIRWSEIWSGFGGPSPHPHQEFPGVPPWLRPPPPQKKKRRNVGRITQNELRVVSCDQAALGTNI